MGRTEPIARAMGEGGSLLPSCGSSACHRERERASGVERERAARVEMEREASVSGGRRDSVSRDLFRGGPYSAPASENGF